MIVVAGFGATTSSTVVTAIFIPMVLRISKGTGAGPERLMILLPLASGSFF